ncbi:hypothetical protein GQ457_13G012020 [Hibiscus cannabinus]
MSEESGEQGNPRVLADGLPSGRPPDPLTSTDFLTEQEAQPVCGDVMQDPILVSDAMETDGEMRGLDVDSEKEESRASYAKVLSTPGRGTLQDQIGLGESVCDPHKILVSNEDCVVDRSGKFPKIEFSERVHKQLDMAMRNVIIVRLLGRNIGYQTLLNRLHVVWKPMGELQLIDLDNSYFLVRIEDPRDYRKILTEGPWTIYGSYLTVQPWSRSFSTSEKHSSKVVVWVRLSGLPYKYYSKALFRRIAAIVGDVVKVDYNTKAGERGKFARLVVTVDLNKPLISCVGIDNFVQKLEYEGLHLICYKCGVYGHLQESCDGTEGRNRDPQDGLASSDMGKEIREDANGKSVLFGPWMTVDTRRKRGYNGASSSRGNSKPGSRNGTNRFAALADDQTVTMEEQETAITIEAGEVSPRRNPSKAVQVGTDKLVVHGLMPKEAGSVSYNSDKSGAFEKAVILPMVEGQHVQVVAQPPTDKGHAAISLLEKGHGKTVAEGVVLGRGRGGKKGGMHSQLTTIVEQSEIDPGGPIRASVNQKGELVPSVSTPTGIGVRAGVSVVGSDGVADGSVADR